jgi:hypothetical protein
LAAALRQVLRHHHAHPRSPLWCFSRLASGQLPDMPCRGTAQWGLSVVEKNPTSVFRFEMSVIPLPLLLVAAYAVATPPYGVVAAAELELELEPIQTHMTQKPLLWVDVGAVRKRSGRAGVVWAGAGVAWRLCVVYMCV